MGSWWHTYHTADDKHNSDVIFTYFIGSICIGIVILIIGILICRALKVCCFREGFRFCPEQIIVWPYLQRRERQDFDVELHPIAEVHGWEDARFRLPVEREDDFMFGIQEARVTMMTKRKE